MNAEKPLIVAGVSSGSREVIEAASNVADALCAQGKKAKLCYTVPESNSMGAAVLNGGGLSEAFEKAGSTEIDTVIILENDLYRRAPKEEIDDFLSKFNNVVVLDYVENETTEKAVYLLPAGSFAESSGTFINNEGRAQRFYKVYHPENKSVKESWRWIGKIMKAADKTGGRKLENFGDFMELVTNEYPWLKDIEIITPPPGFTVAGEKIPREPHRYSGRTAMHAKKAAAVIANSLFLVAGMELGSVDQQIPDRSRRTIARRRSRYKII